MVASRLVYLLAFVSRTSVCPENPLFLALQNGLWKHEKCCVRNADGGGRWSTSFTRESVFPVVLGPFLFLSLPSGALGGPLAGMSLSELWGCSGHWVAQGMNGVCLNSDQSCILLGALRGLGACAGCWGYLKKEDSGRGASPELTGWSGEHTVGRCLLFPRL